MSQLEEHCVECGTKVATISDTPLCSKVCQKKYAMRMIRNMSDKNAWCPTCSKEFDSVKCVCYHHNNKHSFEVRRTEICEECGSVFEPSNSENFNKYCSEECFGDSKHQGFVEIQCSGDFCSKVFKCKRSLYNQHNIKYCSQSCANSGTQNPHWKNKEVRGIRDTPEYRSWKKKVHENYECCVDCGSEENLHAHHKIPISENKDMATDVSNDVILCATCHSKQHPDIPEKLFVNAGENYE